MNESLVRTAADLTLIRQLQAANRALTALGRCSEVAFGARDERVLAQQVCDILVHEAGYRMAWLGLPGSGPDKRMVPLARAGDQGGYLDRVSIRWDDSPQGKGPSGRAMREGRTCFLNHACGDPSFVPWLADARREGFESCIAVPLIAEGRTLGIVVAYATQPDAFDAEEVELLERMARKVAFALAAIRQHHRHEETEEALAESETRYRTTFENAPTGITHTSVDGRWLRLNQRLCEILGYTRAELLERPFNDFTHPDDRETSRRVLAGLVSGELKPEPLEKRFLRKDGATVWVRVTPNLLRDRDGKPVYFITTFEDITDRKRTEAALRQATAQIQAVYEASPDMFFLHDAQGRVVDVNANTERTYGFTREEMRALPFATFTGGDCSMEQAADYLRRAMAGQRVDFEWTARDKAGRDFPVEVRLRRLGEAGSEAAVLAVVRDISQRKADEAALRRSKERFRNLVETTSDWVWELDAKARYTYSSPQVETLLGYAAEELLGHSPYEFMLPEEASRVASALFEAIDTERPFVCFESMKRHRNGQIIHLESSAVPFHDEQGRLLGYRGISRDLTARHMAEHRLREQEERYSHVVALMSEGVLLLDEQGRVVTANASAVRLLGNPADSLLGRSCKEFGRDIVREDGSACPREELPPQRTLITGEPASGAVVGMRHADGTVTWFSINTQPLFRGGSARPTGVLATITDITEQRRAEQELRHSFDELAQAHDELKSVHAQLLQSEKMASIGHLAAGVAHEINNPVGYVSANLGTLEEYVGALLGLLDAYAEVEAQLPAQQRGALETYKRRVDLEFLRNDIEALLRESGEGVARVKRIVQDLKDFSRADEGEWQFANLNRGLESTLNIVWNELKYKAEVIKEFGDLPEVECVPAQLNQVFMNLLVNAGQAIDAHGTITVRSEQVDRDWVRVSVSDTGHGIRPEHLSKLFDPFFTTKPVGQGTGLGLSISYGIVKRHHGRIEVASAPGEGTTFSVWLPLAQDPSLDAQADLP